MTRERKPITRARQLRREMTPAEGILWKELRGRRFVGWKFRRQHPIGPFIADMACHGCKLVLETDGESHIGREKEDAARTAYLERHGWLVLRVWNSEVYGDFDAVVEAIFEACQARSKRVEALPPPLPLSPSKGKGEQEPPAADPF